MSGQKYLHHQLMGTSDHLQVVGVVELLSDVLAKSVAGTTGVHAPPRPVIRVTPQQVTHRSLVRHLLEPLQRPDVVQSFDAGREPTMQTEELVFNDSGEGEEVEELGEALPDVGVTVFAAALVVETVDLSDLPRLVVAPQNGDPVLVAHFEGNEQGDSLDRVVACFVSAVPLST